MFVRFAAWVDSYCESLAIAPSFAQLCFVRASGLIVIFRLLPGRPPGIVMAAIAPTTLSASD